MRYYILSLLFVYTSVLSGQHCIRLDIKNQPYWQLTLVQLKGDKSAVVDTIYYTRGGFYYAVPDSVQSGMYRIFLDPIGKLSQQLKDLHYLDVIYNKEDIKLTTDYHHLSDSLDVIVSDENRAWFVFVKRYNAYQDTITKMESEINYFQLHPEDKYYTDWRKKSIIERYEVKQKARNLFLEKSIRDNSGLFAAKLMRMFSKPVLVGSLSASERKMEYIEHYFDHLDFSDPSLINSSEYTTRIFRYFMLYAQKGLSRQEQEDRFKKAIDVILKQTATNPDVSAFVADYFMRGFESMGLINLLNYLSTHYIVPHGCSDNEDTLKKRLSFQRIKAGEVMPDFELCDQNGTITSLSQFNNDYKLVLFWETTCPVCKEILPSLENWYYSKEMDLEVFAVSIDEDVNGWKQFMSQSNFPWINLNEPHKWSGKVADSYFIYATPTMYLLDKNNKLIAKCISFNEFLDVIADL